MLQADGVAMEKEASLEANGPYYIIGARGNACFTFLGCLVYLFLLDCCFFFFLLSENNRGTAV